MVSVWNEVNDIDEMTRRADQIIDGRQGRLSQRARKAWRMRAKARAVDLDQGAAIAVENGGSGIVDLPIALRERDQAQQRTEVIAHGSGGQVLHMSVPALVVARGEVSIGPGVVIEQVSGAHAHSALGRHDLPSQAAIYKGGWLGLQGSAGWARTFASGAVGGLGNHAQADRLERARGFISFKGGVNCEQNS